MLTSTSQHRNYSIPAATSEAISSVSESDHAGVLADIYQDNFNIAIWRRELPAELRTEVTNLLTSGKAIEIAPAVTRQNCKAEMTRAMGGFSNTSLLIEDITRLVDLFCQLFNRDEIRLRLATLDRVMCPRFHVDNIPCRLITTYLGCSTQWLPHDLVDRSKLGKGNHGLPDERSGIYRSAADIQQLHSGDVAIMKGARWSGSQQFGLVHRSPTPQPGEVRLLLTLDFIS